jgi:[ribosomal protein S18]-alanine N-acetyltransferase
MQDPSIRAKEETRVHIRWCIRRDIDECVQIEQASFDHPWSKEDILKCLRIRNVIGMVAAKGDAILGYMVYELHRGTFHLVNFAVHPAWRRQQAALLRVLGYRMDISY